MTIKNYLWAENLSFLTRAKQFFANVSLTNPKAWDRSLWNIKGAANATGEVVTEETALNYSAVWNAVNLISGTVAGLPLHLMQRQGRANNIADKDPLYYVLHDKPNPYMSSMNFRECLMSHVLTWGNGYAEIIRNGLGEPYALWPIPPRYVNKMEFIDGNLYYEVNLAEGGDTVFIPRANMLHVYGLGFDGYQGYSPVAMARQSIGLGMAMESFGSHYFGSGTHPGVIVSHPKKLDPQTHANMKKSLTDSYSGLGQSHRLMLLEEGLTMEKVGFPNNEAQFLESRQFQIAEIARWYNLPPHKLKDLSKSSFNNIESEQISFVTDSILPWLIRVEECLNMQLLTDRQRSKKLYFKHIVEGLLRANSKDRAEYYKLMIGNGVMTPNEARGKEDMNPSESPYADELWMPTGLIPVSKFDEYLSKNQGYEKPKQEPETENKLKVISN